MARKPSKENSKFNPRGNYTWDADQEFTVYGKEIDLWNKTLNIFARDPQFEKFLYLQEALKTMQTFFEEAVGEGLIKEVKDENKPPLKDLPKATEKAIQEIKEVSADQAQKAEAMPTAEQAARV